MHRKGSNTQSEDEWRLFEAESAYAESALQESMGDMEACIAAVEQALAIKPDYPPAVLTMGSIEYQRGNLQEGARLFSTLLSLPNEFGDLCEVIDKAGDFLIQEARYAEGLKHYEAAAQRFPECVSLYQGVSCCAGHQGLFDKAVEASQRALELEPDSQELVNDLGWSLFEAGRLDEAREVLMRAVDMNPLDELARENLRVCLLELSESPAADEN
ncbi:MAG: tetratricopeptide repeat protein [Desulfonatronovibrio sp.]